LFYNAKHPYTQALLKSMPKLNRKKVPGERLAQIEGMVPDPLNLPSGCVFHPRCPAFMPGKCDKFVPKWVNVGENHYTSCLLYEDGVKP
jgi:peptide/nickel transport system ATP-binding protein